MPIIWVTISALGGLLSGIVYEKESGDKLAQPATTTTPSFNWWDKTLMVAAGIAALYIFKKAR